MIRDDPYGHSIPKRESNMSDEQLKKEVTMRGYYDSG